MVFTQFSTVFQLYHGGPCTYPCSSGVILTSTPHNIPSEPLELLCHTTIVETTDSVERGMTPVAKNYHQSLEGILAEREIEPATSCSQVCNATNGSIGAQPVLHESKEQSPQLWIHKFHFVKRTTESRSKNDALICRKFEHGEKCRFMSACADCAG